MLKIENYEPILNLTDTSTFVNFKPDIVHVVFQKIISRIILIIAIKKLLIFTYWNLCALYLYF